MFVTAYRTVCYKYPHMAIGNVWIYRLLGMYVCLFVFFVRTVTDFSGEDKAIGVKFLHGGSWAS